MLTTTPAPLTREDLSDQVQSWWAAVAQRLSPGSARAQLGFTGAHFDNAAAQLEGFTRPLWGLAPLLAGGGQVDTEPLLAGLTHGTDPSHPEYWGPASGRDQRLVEMAAIGVSLALAPDQLWDPLTSKAKTDLATWLGRINEVECNDNNWLFFRVLVNEGLGGVGAAQADPAASAAALDRLESFYLDGGWYADGPPGRCDYYVPFAFHYYGLIYARLAAERDAARARRFIDRAQQIATDIAHWFDDDGAGLPYGRSLTYRFAQAGFWGALAFADVEALPWGEMNGLFTSNMRWWSGQQITDGTGVMSIGYGYPNLNMAEAYNSPGSPYWAMKAYLPLALPPEHPFWTHAPQQYSREPVRRQEPARLVLCDDRAGGHVFALAAGQNAEQFRHGGAKYSKMAYSTAFAFSVPAGGTGLQEFAADSALALSEDGVHWRTRRVPEEVEFIGDVLWTKWQPWPDVTVQTWLWAHLPWQVRVHRIRTARDLITAEGGWALDRTGDTRSAPQGEHLRTSGAAYARYPAGFSGVLDLDGHRDGEVVVATPNTNLHFPRTVIPTLTARHEAGSATLRSLVLGSTHPGVPTGWAQAPTITELAEHLPAAVRERLADLVLGESGSSADLGQTATESTRTNVLPAPALTTPTPLAVDPAGQKDR